LGHRIRRSVLPPRHRFRLQPVAQVAPIDASQGLWRAEGANPQFLLIAGSRLHPTRWCEFTMRINRSAAGRSPVLRVDLGGGFTDDRAIVLPPARDGIVNAVIELPRLTRALQLELCQESGLLEIKDVIIREISSAKGRKLKKRQTVEFATLLQLPLNSD